MSTLVRAAEIHIVLAEIEREKEMIDWNERLVEILKSKGYSNCPKCNRALDQGDIAWNNASGGSGTPLSMLVCICQSCDNHIFVIHSWYPEIEDLEDVCHVVEEDLEVK